MDLLWFSKPSHDALLEVLNELGDERLVCC